MDFRSELAKWGYNKGNSIDVETLIDEILPSLLSKQERSYSEEDMRKVIDEFWKFWHNQPLEKQFSGEGLRLQPGLNTFAKWLFDNYEIKKK